MLFVADSSQSLAAMFDRLRPEPSERIVSSAVFVAPTVGAPILSHASLLLGPPAMGKHSWDSWAARELAPIFAKVPQPELPRFAISDGGFLAVRETMTVRQARDWLRFALDTGQTASLGFLPHAVVRVGPPKAPALARPGNVTPASAFVAKTVRPVFGFLFRATEEGPTAIPERWAVDPSQPRKPLLDLVGIDVVDADARIRGAPAPPGIFLGRISRKAWLARVEYKRDIRQIHVWIRLESVRVDPYALELEVREYVDNDLADSRRLRLADVRLPARVRGRLFVHLPTLGRQLQRTIRLLHRDGELLDERVGFNFIERMEVGMGFGEGAPPTAVRVGDWDESPSLPERLGNLDWIDDEYRKWLERGARRRIVTGSDYSSVLRSRLARARRELLVIDSYFGKEPSDWSMLDAVGIPIRVLTGWQATPPPIARAGVEARIWTTPPIPFHDRFYLWSGGGFNIGTSPGGLTGRRLFRIDELSRPEVDVLRTQFNAWWRDPQTAPL